MGAVQDSRGAQVTAGTWYLTFVAMGVSYIVGLASARNDLLVCKADLAVVRERRTMARGRDDDACGRRLDACLEANVTCAVAIESAESMSSACRRFLEIGGQP